MNIRKRYKEILADKSLMDKIDEIQKDAAPAIARMFERMDHNCRWKNIIIVILLAIMLAMGLRWNYERKVFRLDLDECRWSEQHLIDKYVKSK